MSSSQDEQGEIKDTSFSLFTDDDDDDMDLETYIANRRRVKHSDAANSKDGPGHEQSTHGVSQHQQAACHNVSLPSMPGTETLEKSRLGQSPARNTQVQTTQTSMDDDPLFWPDEPDFLFNSNHNTPAPSQSTFDEFSLFVEQDEAPRPIAEGSQSKLTQGLLSSTYDSSPEKPDTKHNGVHHETPRRTDIIVNPFSDAGYVESLRQNPYTTGIFSYKGLSKEEAHARVGALREGSKKRKRSSSPKTAAARVPSVKAPPKPTRAPKLEQKKPTASTAPPPPPSTSAGDRPGGLLTPSNSNLDLEAFLTSRIAGCDLALTKFGRTQSENSEEWRALKAQVQGAVDGFANLAAGKKTLDASLRQAIDAWDREIGARVVQQKQVMYTTLLDRIRRAAEDHAEM